MVRLNEPLPETDREFALVRQPVWLSRTGAQRTSVREHRKRRKPRRMPAGVEFTTVEAPVGL